MDFYNLREEFQEDFENCIHPSNVIRGPSSDDELMFCFQDLCSIVYKIEEPVFEGNMHQKVDPNNFKCRSSSVLINLAYPDGYGSPGFILWILAKHGRVEVARAFLRNGLDPNISFKMEPPLIKTIRCNRDRKKEMVELLLEYGADPHIKDRNGLDTFYWAQESPEIMRMLSSRD